MSAEDTNVFRLNRMEDDIKEMKGEVKEIANEQGSQREKLIVMGGDLKSNLETNKIIKNTAIAFLVVNALGLIWAFMTKVY